LIVSPCLTSMFCCRLSWLLVPSALLSDMLVSTCETFNFSKFWLIAFALIWTWVGWQSYLLKSLSFLAFQMHHIKLRILLRLT
jgi:hypothetical protein